MSKSTFAKTVLGAVISTIFLGPVIISAQVLEEIVVTAQRREQSLQEVPISIYSMSGAELQKQGFKDLRGFADFSPTVQFDDTSVIGVTISIRGFGTTGNAVTLESAVPIFVDNLHYSRQSMMKTAFLDVEAVEVLKGPQPVYFGQNATAGAFNIRSRRPTRDWDGNIQFEYGDRSNQSVQAAMGGPVSDTLAIRGAITYDSEDGFIKHIVTGEGIGKTKNIGGRVSLLWEPMDNLNIYAKFDAAKLDRDSEAHTICFKGGSTLDGSGSNAAEGISADSYLVPPPLGIGWDQALIAELPSDCYNTNLGIKSGGPYYAPPIGSRSRDSDTGHPDIRLAAAGFVANSAVPGFYEKNLTNNGIEAYEDLRTKTTELIIDYEFDNGIVAEWSGGYVKYGRDYIRDNQNSVFLDNFQGREENYDQWSTELRINSASGGMIEWVVGAFYQVGDLDVFSSSIGAHVRRGQRFNNVWEDQKWKSAFGVLTFNFLDDKASLDVGGRYSDLFKETRAHGYGAQWVFDVFPCTFESDPLVPDWEGGGDLNPATCAPHPQAVMLDPVLDSPRIYDENADLTNLWTIPYNSSRGGGGRKTPVSWRGNRAHAVGLTAPDFAVREGPWQENFSASRVDPQVVLRYRPTDNISMYARWAKAYKAGGFDTGQTSIPDTLDAYQFGPEFAEQYEGGVKGTFRDGRGRFDLNIFQTTFRDLQLSVSTPNPDDPFANLNAGQQRVKGAEFSVAYGFSEQLRGAISGAILDGVMNVFENAPCTEQELADAPGSGCDPVTELIDRSGQSAPNTPDWKFVFDLDYWVPVPGFDDHKFTFNTKAYVSDGYCDSIGDCGITRWDSHGDANVTWGLGRMDDKWEISAYVKNIFHPTVTQHLEESTDPDLLGIQTPSLAPSRFISYGIRLRYNFF